MWQAIILTQHWRAHARATAIFLRRLARVEDGVTLCPCVQQQQTKKQVETMMLRSLVVALVALGSASAFAPVGSSARSGTSLQMSKENDGGKMVAASFLTGAFLAVNAIFCADAAIAATPDLDFGSTEIVAGRSGGRGGGRAARAPSRPAPRSSTTTNTRTIERTTIIQPTPVYTAPSVVVSPFGYNPFGGFGKSCLALAS